MNLKLFLILALISLVSIFVVQNTEIVELRFLFWKLDMSRALMFVFLLLSGIVTGWFLHAYLIRKEQHREPNK
jgi:uncharacterized integral membrane protein